jgi:integron integrase
MSSDLTAIQADKPKLLDQVRTIMRLRRMSYRTEESYLHWIRRFIVFHGKRHPSEMGEPEIREFLSHLVMVKNVASATQNQALHALLFLYKQVLEIDLPRIGSVARSNKQPKLPVVFTREEVRAVLAQLDPPQQLMAGLLYGSGLRLIELLRLRVKDIDFTTNQITVREGKGAKDRRTMLPQHLKEPLRQHLAQVRRAHEADLLAGYGTVHLPFALARKYPEAAKEWKWQYFFPAPKRSIDPRSGILQRHHLDERSLQKAVKEAIYKAGVDKHASCHTFRHSFATHLLESGYDIRTV